MSYYERHIFFCLNKRDNGEASCAQHQAQQGRREQAREDDLVGEPQHLDDSERGCRPAQAYYQLARDLADHLSSAFGGASKVKK